MEFNIADILKETRISKKISQSQLCKGLCSKSMISKLETGQRYPSKFLFCALMERMGESGDICNIIGYSTDSKIEYARNIISNCVNNKLYIQLETEIINFKNLITEDDILNQQFLYLSLACLENNNDKKLEYCIKAINFTIPNFKYNDIDKYLLSHDEIIIINIIAGCYKKNKKFKIAAQIYEALYMYIEIHITNIVEKKRSVLLILSNLTNTYILTGKYYDSLVYCDKAIEMAIKYENIRLLHNIYYNKAISLARIGNSKAANQAAISAYSLSNIMQKTVLAESYKKDLEQSVGIHFSIDFL